MVNQLQLQIKEIIQETAESKTFIFFTDNPVEYKAGQFLTFIFIRNGHERRRSYSLSSSPDVDDHLAITLKRVINGEISGWWLTEARIGDRLTALPPAGLFTIEWQHSPRDIFLVAAGSGITPVFSILKSALIKEPNSRVILVYSNSSLTNTIFAAQLAQLQQKHPQLLIEWRFSNHKSLLKARLSTYNLQFIVQKQLFYPLDRALVYTCGPYNFMMMVQITCLTMGFTRQNVRKEIFDISPPPPNIRRYFDETDRTITIWYNGAPYTVSVPYQSTILDAALQQGIQLPYSCKAGRCSTCRCKVLNGRIWMHYNEVLTDADEEQGYALTCTGHPASDDVVIEL